MKIYALIHHSQIANHVVIFEIEPDRLRTLLKVCKDNGLHEAVVDFREYEVKPMAHLEAVPTDGFMSNETAETFFDADEYDPEAKAEIDKDMTTLEALHVGAQDQVHIELVEDGETFWSEGLDMAEIERWLYALEAAA